MVALVMIPMLSEAALELSECRCRCLIAHKGSGQRSAGGGGARR